MTRHKDAALFDGIPDDLINDFAAVRRAKKAPITATAINGIKREAAKAGITLEAAITMCVERNWQGFRAEWALRVEDSGQQSQLGKAGQATATAAQEWIRSRGNG